jgi:hypothetical protein
MLQKPARAPRAYVENAAVKGEVVRIDGTIHVRPHYHLVSPAPLAAWHVFAIRAYCKTSISRLQGAGARASEMSLAEGSVSSY